MPSFVYTAIALALIYGLWMVVEKHLSIRKVQKAPRITTTEFDALKIRLAKATLPIAWVTLRPADDPAPASSRIGGRPYIDSPRRKWPVRGRDKLPMLFLGQINFAEVPPLQDFPRHGLLQLFGLADAHGNIQSTDYKRDRVIRWFSDPTGMLTLDLPFSLMQHQKGRTFSTRVIGNGLSMAFESSQVEANPDNWPYNDSYPDLNRRLAENDELRQKIEIWEKAKDEQNNILLGRSWIGGHPLFFQNNIREEPRLRKLNRVLFHLASDVDDICLGDAGALNLMISAKDLRSLDFDKSYCTWDCV